MSQVWKDGRSPKVTCSARTVAGIPCKKPPIKGSNVCRTHGGAAPQVRAKAQVRILMSADAAAAKLIEMIHSKKVDDRTKLMAVKDLLDRANLAGTQNIEIGVSPKRSFEDFVGDALVEYEVLHEPGSAPSSLALPEGVIVDAEVVEDEYDEPVVNKRDRAAFREVTHARRAAAQGLRRRDSERDAEEAATLAAIDRKRQQSDTDRGREAFLIALDAGATHDQANAAAKRAAEGAPLTSGKRRARVSTADFRQG